MEDHPAADQPDPIAPPDNPDQPLRGPQWARSALANQHDPETKARELAELPMTDFEGSGFIRHATADGATEEVREAIIVDDDGFMDPIVPAASATFDEGEEADDEEEQP